MKETFLGAVHADPWSELLLDLPALNAQASDSVEQTVLRLREFARRDPGQLRSESLVLLGPPGTGKTHLFARLRKKLGPRAVFVHIRPLLHAGMSTAFVLKQAVEQLSRTSGGRFQADALVGSLIGLAQSALVSFPTAHLDEWRSLTPEARKQQIEETVDALLERFPDLDDSFVERLLQVPFVSPRERRALLAWLAGHDCDPSQLERIGASASLPEDGALRALQTLGTMAALGAPLVLVFDQLENLVQRDQVEERITQYGNLIAELVDSTRGLLIVQMALDSEWEVGIEPRFNLSQRSRAVMKKASLSLPTPAQSNELLTLWHAALDAPAAPLPWPFTREQVDQLLQLPGLTPRMLLTALREAREGQSIGLLEQPTPVGSSPEASLVSAGEVLPEEWHARLVSAHHSIDSAEARRGGLDSERLCDGILSAASFAPDLRLRATQKKYIQITPREGQGRWVALVNQPHPSSIGAALRRALQQPPHLPGLVVREQWCPISPTAGATLELQDEVLRRPHVTWFELGREQAAQLLALDDLLQAARSADIMDSAGRPLSEELVRSYVREELHPERWELIRELALTPPETRRQDEEGERGSVLEATATPPSVSAHEPPPAGDSTVESILLRLRIASVDRLIREVRRLRGTATRHEVVEQLEGLGSRVAWYGRNLVEWKEAS